VSLKSFTILAGLGVTVLAAVVLALFRTYMEGPPLWAIAAGGLGVVALAAWWWHGELGRGANYVEFSSEARRWMARMITAAVLVHCVWLVWTLADLDSWRAHALRLIGLSLLEWVVALAWDHRLTHLLPQAKPAAEVEVYRPTLVANNEPRLQPADERMQLILQRGGWPYVLVTKVWMLPDGHKGATFECRALSKSLASELSGKEVSTVKAIAPGDEEDLAIAAEEELGVDLETSWVRIQPTRRPGRVLVTIATEDIFAKPLPYQLVTTLADPAEPIVLGSQVHGDPAALNVRQHGVICGPTGSGKTGLVNVLFAELTRRPGRIFVCGVEKIYDLVGQWLDVHLDTDNDLPITAVVGIDDTLQLLAEVYYEARRRQNLEHHERANLEPWYIVIEEAPAVLNNNERQIEIEGRNYNASALVAHLDRTILSVEMYMKKLAQEYDNAMFGDSAASIKGNSGYKILMRSQSGDERSRAFGRGYAALRDLNHPGEMYIKDNADPYAAKCRYINEMHANKKRLHEGVDIATVSLARSALVKARAKGPLSPWMAALPTRMTRSYRDYLQGKCALPMDAGTSRIAIEAVDAGTLVDKAIADLEAQLDERDARRLRVVDNEPAKPRMRDFIATTLADNTDGMTTDEVLSAVLAAGYEQASKSSVENALTALRGKGRIRSVDGPSGRRVHQAA
jgi:hypothetical protein